MPALVAVWAIGLAVAIWTIGGATPRSGEVIAAEEIIQAEEGYVGSETCAVCHQEAYDHYQVSVHAQTETGDWPAHGCESCHGPGEAHVEDPVINRVIFDTANTGLSVADKAGQCLSCHASDATTFDYRSSSHMKGAIDCTACHKPHTGRQEDQLLAREVPPDRLFLGAATESCLGCHQEIRATLNLNERHRVLEGMVTCADCHQQHNPSPRSRLGGFSHETCISCHTDKGGPFVFEHLSSRVEGCTTCHDPHGSVNRHMLSFQREADLCYSCHVEVPSFHRGFGPATAPPRFDSTTTCTNCHSAIHGSNLDHVFLQ